MTSISNALQPVNSSITDLSAASIHLDIQPSTSLCRANARRICPSLQRPHCATGSPNPTVSHRQRRFVPTPLQPSPSLCLSRTNSMPAHLDPISAVFNSSSARLRHAVRPQEVVQAMAASRLCLSPLASTASLRRVRRVARRRAVPEPSTGHHERIPLLLRQTRNAAVKLPSRTSGSVVLSVLHMWPTNAGKSSSRSCIHLERNQNALCPPNKSHLRIPPRRPYRITTTLQMEQQFISTSAELPKFMHIPPINIAPHASKQLPQARHSTGVRIWRVN